MLTGAEEVGGEPEEESSVRSEELCGGPAKAVLPRRARLEIRRVSAFSMVLDHAVAGRSYKLVRDEKMNDPAADEACRQHREAS